MAKTAQKTGSSSGTVPKTARPQPKGGSRKGIPNKTTKALKDMILGALDDAGGQKYLTACAKNPRTAGTFLQLVGKVLPLQITGEGGGPVMVTRVELISGDNSKG